MVSFFSQLHMNLLMDYPGRLVNGVGGFLTTALSLTGIVIRWPGPRKKMARQPEISLEASIPST